MHAAYNSICTALTSLVGVFLKQEAYLLLYAFVVQNAQVKTMNSWLFVISHMPKIEVL